MKEESANLFRTCAQFDTSLDRTIYKGLNTHKRLCTHLHFAQYIEASFAPLALFQNKEEEYQVTRKVYYNYQSSENESIKISQYLTFDLKILSIFNIRNSCAMVFLDTAQHILNQSLCTNNLTHIAVHIVNYFIFAPHFHFLDQGAIRIHK